VVNPRMATRASATTDKIARRRCHQKPLPDARQGQIRRGSDDRRYPNARARPGDCPATRTPHDEVVGLAQHQISVVLRRGQGWAHGRRAVAKDFKRRKAMPRVIERCGEIRLDGERLVEARARLLAASPAVQREPRRRRCAGSAAPAGLIVRPKRQPRLDRRVAVHRCL
jgi:hypothetical protein